MFSGQPNRNLWIFLTKLLFEGHDIPVYANKMPPEIFKKMFVCLYYVGTGLSG